MNKLKEMLEKRNSLVEEMEKLINSVADEVRAFTDEENTKFENLKSEVRKLDNTIEAIKNTDKADVSEMKADKGLEEEEIRSFASFLRGKAVESRATGEFSVGNNGNVIPTHLANKIIEKVKELSPIYRMVTVYNVGGDLKFPVYDETDDTGASFVEDMTELEATAGKFTLVSLENHIVGVLKLISKSIINRTDFDLVSFVITKTAENIVEFLEKNLLNGTDGKCEGVFKTENLVTSASATAVTADELIDVQMTVPTSLQDKACWIMNKETFKAIRKLKDGDGNYILNPDIRNGFGWTLLGKPVYLSDNAPKMATGNTAIVYGDMSGLYVKFAQGIEMQILQEKYATKHAIGVVAYVEFDSKIVEVQKIAGLKMA